MAVQYIDHAVATGTGTTITWTIPTHNSGDLIILGFRSNNSSTTSTIDAVPSGYTMIFDRREATGGYPNWVFAKNATGSDSASVTLSVSGGWRAIAIIIRGHNPTIGATYPMFEQEGGTHYDTESTITGGVETISAATSMYLVLSMNRLAASGTATFSSSPSETWTEVVDSYASNLHTAFAYCFPGAEDNTPTVQLTTSDANSTKTSQWRFVIAEGATSNTGTLSGTIPQMTASTSGTVEFTGSITSVLPEMTASVDGEVLASGTLSGTIPELAAEMTGETSGAGTLEATLPELVAEFTGEAEIPPATGSIDATIPGLSADASGTVSFTGTATAAIPELAAEFSGTVEAAATLSGTLPELTASISGESLVGGSVSASLPELTAAVSGEVFLPATLAASLPEMTMEMAGSLTSPPSPFTMSKVPAEDRVSYVSAENRVSKVGVDDRVSIVEREDRVSRVKAEDRTSIVT